MLLFMDFDHGTAKTSIANLNSFKGVLLKLVACLSLISLSSFLTYSVVVYGNKRICFKVYFQNTFILTCIAVFLFLILLSRATCLGFLTDDFLTILTLFRMGLGGGQKGPSTSVSPETSTNVGISSQNFLAFSFNPFVTLV